VRCLVDSCNVLLTLLLLLLDVPLLCVEQSLYNTFLQLLPEALVVVVVAGATPVVGAVSILVDSLLTGSAMLWLLVVR
jgi:hypothetical protein